MRTYKRHFIFIVAVIFLTACSQKDFGAINKLEKAKVLEEHMSAEDSGHAGVETQDTSKDDGDETSDGRNEPIPPKTVDDDVFEPEAESNGPTQKYELVGKDTVIQISRGCRGMAPLPNIFKTTTATLKVMEGTSVKCQVSGAQLKQQLSNKRRITIPDCNFERLSPSATLALFDDTDDIIGTAEIIRHKNVSQGSQSIKDLKDGFSFTFLYKDGMTIGINDPRCDHYNASPLVVDLRARAQLKNKIELTAPADGVDFDILGENAKPEAHAKYRISWFTDPQVMFIALPNAKGEVNGVNELFGDNTKGPDGRFADHGFAALAKHDSNGDSYITADDKIFKKLRLWSDVNLDGVAQKSELFQLSQYSITIIDLNFDPGYYRRDQHGNEFKYKSVVKRERDGKSELRPVFDIWFNLKSGF